MFTTFNVQNGKSGQTKQVSAALANSSSTGGVSGSNGNSTSPTAPTRPKRSQIARACDFCRLNRIKCDNDQPCKNCKNRGTECTSNGRAEARSQPHVIRENERLKNKVKELEEELEKTKISQRHNSYSTTGGLPTPPATAAVSPSSLTPLEDDKSSRRYWEGAWTNPPQPHMRQLHGPTASYYFIARLSSFLGLALQQPNYEQYMQPNVASKVFASPTSPEVNPSAAGPGGGEDSNGVPTASDMFAANGEYLTRTQEDYFLSLFWQTYHCMLPILDELEFRDHYESLWFSTPHGQFRRPSPLVDIILALCMQYGMAFVPRNDPDPSVKGNIDSNDSSIAGRGFYRRCQAMLTAEQERPSIATLQCYLYSSLYLQNASFMNSAHNMLAIAVRTAYILGLHQRPAEDIPRGQQELHRRIWWATYAMETKTCVALGRPWLIQPDQVACRLPADDQATVHMSSNGVNFVSPCDDITWLSYQVQCVKMIICARTVHSGLASKCTDLINSPSPSGISSDDRDLYNDPRIFEDLAAFLSRQLHCVRQWVQNVPEGLRTERRGGGSAFSTDRSALEIDPMAPVWLQRQRLLLEMRYHDQIMNLYRPFIRFSVAQKSATPLADGHAISCLNHAMALTNIIYQVLTETNILHGWHEAYKLQWNAALSIIGFCFGYPICPPAPAARRAINTVIEVFEIFGDNFAAAASAAEVTRDLANKVDILIDRFRPGSSASATSSSHNTAPATPASSVSNGQNQMTFDPMQLSGSLGSAAAEAGLGGVPGSPLKANAASNSALLPSLSSQLAPPLSDALSSFDGNNLAAELGLSFSMNSFNNVEALTADGMSEKMWVDFISD